MQIMTVSARVDACEDAYMYVCVYVRPTSLCSAKKTVAH